MFIYTLRQVEINKQSGDMGVHLFGGAKQQYLEKGFVHNAKSDEM